MRAKQVKLQSQTASMNNSSSSSGHATNTSPQQQSSQQQASKVQADMAAEGTAQSGMFRQLTGALKA